MFVRLLYESFRRQRQHKLLAGIAITLGACVATAMLGVATNIGDKMSRELSSYGANIIVTPQDDTLDLKIDGAGLKLPVDSAYLSEADLPKIHGMFWHNNIVGFAPMLPVSVSVAGVSKSVTLLGTYFSKRLTFDNDRFTTGVKLTDPWWSVRGAWPGDNSTDVLVGERLARRLHLEPGDRIRIAGRPHGISGILSTGGTEDDQIVAPLSVAQHILGRPGAVRRLYVSAVTKPEDALARRNPKTMDRKMFDRWYCSPYVQSVAYQLQEAIPHSHAEQIRQVAQTEGAMLTRIEGLMLLVTMAALLAAALAVSAAMATAIFERRDEVGLMKALGAGDGSVAALFFAEAALLAVIGGVAGFAGGAMLARQIGRWIFNSAITVDLVLLPIVVAIAVLVAFAGSAVAIRRAVKSDPTYSLRGQG